VSFTNPQKKKSHEVKSGDRGGHRINASSSQFLRLVLDVQAEELCTDSLHLGVSHTTSWYCWKEALPSGILFEIETDEVLAYSKTKWLLKFTERHICYYCPLAANRATMFTSFSLEVTWRVSLSISVRMTIIRCVVYLLQIFKMFHGIMNKPVYSSSKYIGRLSVHFHALCLDE
jgi:hypothetical protein